MIISKNWLKQYVDIELEDDELLSRIASRIGEIESVKSLKEKYEKAVVAEVIEAKDHPDADKLGVYLVDNGKQKLQVVAGDRSLKVGDKVAHLPVGSIVPATFHTDDQLKLEKRDLRGEESNGMLASLAELDFGDDHEGVLVLDTDSNAGTYLIDVYELDDLIFEIENKALTHRPDCFGFIGIAREVAGIQNTQFKSPSWFLDEVIPPTKADDLELHLDNQLPELVSRITLRAFSGVEIKKSPLIMQSYLSRVGVRPINNIVDITNYLMLTSGQPLHAFDYDKVAAKSSKGATIVVRKPEKGEKLTLLDEREIEVHKDAILIATDEEALALAGAMGGADSEVDENTKNVLLEVANFDLYSIRESSMKHGIFTEAVTRFSRGQDPQACIPVQNRALVMFEDLASASAASDLVDDNHVKQSKKPIKISADFVNSRLGTSYDQNTMETNLANVEFAVSSEGDEMSIKAPSWRPDINIKEDIVEEIGRLNGFDSIDVTLPTRSLKPVGLPDTYELVQQIRNQMAAYGASEQLSYNFVSSELFNICQMDSEQAFRLRNAISPKLNFMRTAITPGLLEKVNPNIRKKFFEIALFEIGKSHSKTETGKDKLPLERLSLSLVYSAESKLATSKYSGAPYYAAKTYVDDLLDSLNISQVSYSPLTDKSVDPWVENLLPVFKSSRSAIIRCNSRIIGVLGEFNASVINGFKLPEFTSGAELDLTAIEELYNSENKYEVLSKFPQLENDITLKTPDSVSYEQLRLDLLKALETTGFDMSLSPISIYRGQDQTESRNITFRVSMRPIDKTGTTQQANEIFEKAASQLEQNLQTQQV